MSPHLSRWKTVPPSDTRNQAGRTLPASTGERRKVIRLRGLDGDVRTLEEIFRLRYEVYCLECAFLPAGDFQRGLETDEYDAHATHFAAYNHEQKVVGSMRLVHPGPDLPLPFERYCSVFPSHRFAPRAACGEISRLVVKKNYRRRRGDSLRGFTEQEGAAFLPQRLPNRRAADNPMLLLAMYRELYRHSRQNGIRYWYAAMERALIRALERMGFCFIPIGPVAQYYGAVTPCMVDLHILEHTLAEHNPELLRWFMA